MRAPVISSRAQSMRRSHSMGTRVLRCEPSSPPGIEPISSEIDQVRIDVAQPEMQKAGDAGQYHGMHNVGAHIDLGRETVEQQQQHHDDAARTHRSHADQKAGDQADHRHAGETTSSSADGWRRCSSIRFWNSNRVGTTISRTPTAVLMKLLTPSP